MKLKSLGTLTNPEITYQHTWESTPVPVPLFSNSKLKFIIESKGNDLSEIDNAVLAFLKIPADTIATISNHIYQLYLDFIQAVDSDYLDFKISSQNEVWEHVTPTSIVVRKNSSDNQVYIQVFVDCDWDLEHGIQLIFKDGNQLSRVSTQDDHLTEPLASSNNKIDQKTISTTMYIIHDNCPVCNSGPIGYMTTNTGDILCVCDECESVWQNKDDIYSSLPKDFKNLSVSAANWSKIEEIITRELEKNVIGSRSVVIRNIC